VKCNHVRGPLRRLHVRRATLSAAVFALALAGCGGSSRRGVVAQANAICAHTDKQIAALPHTQIPSKVALVREARLTNTAFAELAKLVATPAHNQPGFANLASDVRQLMVDDKETLEALQRGNYSAAIAIGKREGPAGRSFERAAIKLRITECVTR
jgi:hypothetical protein